MLLNIFLTNYGKILNRRLTLITESFLWERTRDLSGEKNPSQMNRRTFVEVLGAAGVGIILGAGFSEYVLHPPSVPSGTTATVTATTTATVVDTTTITEVTHVPLVPLEPRILTKYLDPLPIPSVMQPTNPGATSYEVSMTEFKQQLHSELPPTTVWGYNGSYPGPTFEATKGTPISVRYVSKLPSAHLFAASIDHTIHGAESSNPDVRNVVHLHGAEVKADSDGHPDVWFTPGFGKKGPAWSGEIYNYPNSQEATTLWYHDHAIGITRLNVDAGLAGFYLIRDPAVESAFNLPTGAYEIPILIQDRSFDTDGSLFYPVAGVNPTIHPQWVPEFFGDAILVNGKVWPYLEVEPRKYRFRILNGSNARFYHLSLSTKIPVYQIGTDGGYLPKPVPLSELLLAPAERADVIVDFTGLEVGTELLLQNDANAPFPDGEPADPDTVGQIMQFRVISPKAPDTSSLPETLVPVQRLPEEGAAIRPLILNEVQARLGPTMSLLNNSMWDKPITEKPKLGSTEIWEIINTTGDAHPIHLHLVQFQILDRQELHVEEYNEALHETNEREGVQPGEGGTIIPVDRFLEGKRIPPDPNEAGWKDTVRVDHGTVTRIIVKFGPRFTSDYAFDATAAPHYVWHCHILEHEDNEMMHRYQIVP
jgi:spore coat protein A